MVGPNQEVRSIASYFSCRGAAFQRLYIPHSDPILVKKIEEFSIKNLARSQSQDKLDGSNKRRKFSYISNKTNARMCENIEGDSEMKQECLLNDPIKSIQDSIVDHAYRRIQLFYYLCVAYYKENCFVNFAKTNIQHGKASRQNHSAAHSSILPNVSDDFFNQIFIQITSQGYTNEIDTKLKALGLSKKGRNLLKLGKPEIDQVYETLQQLDTSQGLLNDECEFYHNMNATVELPNIVNEYDCIIENKLRVKALELLNEVSFGIMTPYEALKSFTEKMQQFFEYSENETKRKIDCLERIASLELKLWRLEQNFFNKNVTDYIKALRKLSDQLKYIHNTKGHSLPIKLKGRFSHHSAVIDYALNPRKNDHDYKGDSIKNLVSQLQPWFPEPIAGVIEPLQASLKVIEYQKMGTVVPSLEMLSGKFINGERIAMDEEELMEQKLEIIQRQKI